MKVGYLEMMRTPYHIILQDLDMIHLEHKHPPKASNP